MSGLIHDVPMLLGLLARGTFAEHVNGQLETLLKALEESTSDSSKGSLTITLEFKHELGRTDVAATSKVKPPETAKFMKTPFWIVDGKLSVQHPHQIDMFGGPRGVPRRMDDDDAMAG